MIVVGASYGNDSIATIQFLREEGLTDVVVLYNDTGWPSPEWPARVDAMEAWVRSIGYATARTESEGMEALVYRKRGWPRQGMQFCTEHLKVGPTIMWLREHDPEGEAICVNGKRAAESQERSDTVEWIEASELHGGRRLWQPLHAHTVEMRDALILRAGHEVLPHKSRECWLCVNTGREGLRAASEGAIAWVERVEANAGYTKAGKPRTMFRPARKMGATGIREVLAWALPAPANISPANLTFWTMEPARTRRRPAAMEGSVQASQTAGRLVGLLQSRRPGRRSTQMIPTRAAALTQKAPDHGH